MTVGRNRTPDDQQHRNLMVPKGVRVVEGGRSCGREGEADDRLIGDGD